LTGNGIKDPEIAMQQCADAKPVTIDASLDAVKRAILDHI
jgi:threonine synthase